MTTADKLEAEAKRLRGYVAVRRKHEYTPEMYRAARLAERDEALAAAWRFALEAACSDVHDWPNCTRPGCEDICPRCCLLKRIDALEIDA